MPNADAELLVNRVMDDTRIASFIEENKSVGRPAREAVERLLKENPKAPFEDIVNALRGLLQPLLSQKLTVFFSYKAKDESIATQIANWLKEWSAGNLKIEYMARFGAEQVGRNWRRKIEETIQRCDWFLLLLPSPGAEGNERDWVLYEAGYFLRGQSLSGRLVCLHHPENDVADSLDDKQSVPAKTKAVEKFLEGLFKEPNWLPGMQPINSELSDLKGKAEGIVNLIKQTSQSVRFCCGPHMEVEFDDASAVSGWEELASGRVSDSNEDCKILFGLDVRKLSLGDWLAEVEGVEVETDWIEELARAIQAAAKGHKIPLIRGTFLGNDGRRVRPAICSVTRRKSDQSVAALGIQFSEAEIVHDTSLMDPGLAALAIMLWFSVRFRYQVLERYAGRKLEGKDVLAFNKALLNLQREAAIDPHFQGDWSLIRKKTLELFVGVDKTAVEKIYERWDELYRADGEGEMDEAIANLDAVALTHLVEELGKMNQSFLTVTSKRFAEFVAGT